MLLRSSAELVGERPELPSGGVAIKPLITYRCCVRKSRKPVGMLTSPFPFPPLKGTLVEGQVDKHRCTGCFNVEGTLNKKLQMGSGEGEVAGAGMESTG